MFSIKEGWGYSITLPFPPSRSTQFSVPIDSITSHCHSRRLLSAAPLGNVGLVHLWRCVVWKCGALWSGGPCTATYLIKPSAGITCTFTKNTERESEREMENEEKENNVMHNCYLLVLKGVVHFWKIFCW